MSDKQAAVIYRRVTRSANGFAIMKKQHLSSFVVGQGTLVPCIFMRFSKNFQVSSCGLFVCLFVCFLFFDEIAFSNILRNKLKRFDSGAILFRFCSAFSTSKLSKTLKLEALIYCHLLRNILDTRVGGENFVINRTGVSNPISHSSKIFTQVIRNRTLVSTNGPVDT